MPLLNYTTKVNVFTTIGEIQEILVKHAELVLLNTTTPLSST